MLTSILIVSGIVAYWGIGRLVGKWRWKTWKKEKRTVASFFLFPLSHINDRVGDNRSTIALISDFEDEKSYIVASSPLWPFSLAVSFLMTVFVSLSFVITRGLALDYFVRDWWHRQLKSRYLEWKQKRFGDNTAPSALPEREETVSDIAALRETLAKELEAQRQIEKRIDELKEQIFLEEGRIHGNYREAALMVSKQDRA